MATGLAFADIYGSESRTSPVGFPVAAAVEIPFIFADTKGGAGGLVSSIRRA